MLEFGPYDYLFWNYNLLLFMGYEDDVNIIDIFTGEIDYLYDTDYSYLMKKIYLDDCEESIMFAKKYWGIRLFSYKRSSYLINAEKEEFQKMKEKNNKRKEEYDKENPKIKEKYDALLDDTNLGSFFD